MSKPIRIGTRDSELALWQAKAVQSQLEHLGHKSILVPIKSTGDVVLDKPLYELGITGIFTKTLDIALLNGKIDIAVHSLKDVPTILPKGIVQAAVLKRGNINDTLVFKNNEEFLSQKEAIIATGSLRRRAQWLNRYPTHTVVDLRGNVNLRLQKLRNNNWNGAIFAAAGIGRLNLRPKEAINLDWMIPAPAQGAVMIAALEKDKEILNTCSEINHEETDICTQIEREFLNRLEGGCTAPIGALAEIKNEEVHFKAILLSKNGQKKVTVSKVMPLSKHHTLAKFCADYVISKGGKTLMDELKEEHATTNIYSTKTLSKTQKKKFHKHAVLKSNDAIKISFNRLPKQLIKRDIKHVIITSKNAVEALLNNFSASELKFKNIYCVGRRTKKLIEQRLQKVKHQSKNAQELAKYIIANQEIEEVTFFCSDIRLEVLPETLQKNNIKVEEIIAYETKYDAEKIDSKLKGIMFFSPSTVESYLKVNQPQGIAFCIGETTATAAKLHFKDVRIAKIPTVESVIDLVNEYFL